MITKYLIMVILIDVVALMFLLIAWLMERARNNRLTQENDSLYKFINEEIDRDIVDALKPLNCYKKDLIDPLKFNALTVSEINNLIESLKTKHKQYLDEFNKTGLFSLCFKMSQCNDQIKMLQKLLKKRADAA